jgi:hypothetical protein
MVDEERGSVFDQISSAFGTVCCVVGSDIRRVRFDRPDRLTVSAGKIREGVAAVRG